jgi:hypothetical protein
MDRRAVAQQRYCGQLALAGEDVGAKDREPVSPFDQLHGGGVTRVYLDGVRHALPGDEVDPIQTDQTKPGCNHGYESIRQLQDLGLPAEQPELRSSQDTSAVTKPPGPKSRVPNQLAGEAQDPGIGPVGSK